MDALSGVPCSQDIDMTLEGARIWLATRGSGRVPYYQSHLLDALTRAGAASVDVLDFGALFRSAAFQLGTRATDWVEEAAGRLLKSLDVRRLIGRSTGPEPTPEEVADTGSLKEHPDLIVVDDPGLFKPLRLLEVYRQGEALVVGLVDDFLVDTRWRKSSTHALIVPHETLKAPHQAEPGSQPVKVAGPPAAPGYTCSTALAQARAQLGLDLGLPVLIVAGETCHPDTLVKAVFQITLLEPAPAVLFDHGGNEQNAQLLRAAARNYGLPAQMFGPVENRGLYYAAGDLVLAGADDPQVNDILLCGRPVILVGSDRGAARASFLADQGAVLWFEDVLELGARLEKVIGPAKWPAVAEKAGTLVRIQGVAEIVEALSELLGQREIILTREAPQPQQPTPTPSQPVAGVTAIQVAPFESIGSKGPEEGDDLPGTPITVAEAKDQMAALILKEREAERALTQASRERDKWIGRLDMANEVAEEDLVISARRNLALAVTQVERLEAQLQTTKRSKDKLKQRVAQPKRPSIPRTQTEYPVETKESPTRSSEEDRFRTMEVERDLARLRKRLRDEGKS